jgi:hypothetical protein
MIVFYYLVEIKLKNTTRSSVEFLSFSCTSEDFFVLNNDCVKTCHPNCSGNSITVINLKPKQIYTLSIILQAENEDAVCDLKIGFIYIETRIEPHFVYDELIKKRKNLENILWSDQIYLHPTVGIPYEIK